jgi:hypothetical protein
MIVGSWFSSIFRIIASKDQGNDQTQNTVIPRTARTPNFFSYTSSETPSQSPVIALGTRSAQT